MIDSVFSLGAFFIVMIATRSAFHWTMLYLVIIIMQVYIFSLGLTFLLAALEVFFRDMEYLWGVALMLIMYMLTVKIVMNISVSYRKTGTIS